MTVGESARDGLSGRGAGFVHAGLGGLCGFPESLMERRRLQVLYSGHVQGVGFRYTVKSLAAGFEVTGTIRNLADGRVELLVEGSRDELLAFQQAIRDSGLGPLITHETPSWSDPRNEFRGFAIVG